MVESNPGFSGEGKRTARISSRLDPLPFAKRPLGPGGTTREIERDFPIIVPSVV